MKKISPALKLACQEQAQSLLGAVEGIRAVIVATSDGFDVAAAMRSDLSVERIAALSSSISAIGDVVSMETHLGHHDSVFVNAESGYAVLFSIRRTDINLVLSVVASSDALLGTINYMANAACKAIQAVPASNEHTD